MVDWLNVTDDPVVLDRRKCYEEGHHDGYEQGYEAGYEDGKKIIKTLVTDAVVRLQLAMRKQ